MSCGVGRHESNMWSSLMWVLLEGVNNVVRCEKLEVNEKDMYK